MSDLKEIDDIVKFTRDVHTLLQKSNEIMMHFITASEACEIALSNNELYNLVLWTKLYNEMLANSEILLRNKNNITTH